MKYAKAAFLRLVTLFLCAFLMSAPLCATASTTKSDLPFDVADNIVLLIEADTGAIIFSQNEKKRVPIASVTKIMTLLLAFEAIDRGDISLDDAIVISKTAASTEGSQAFLDAGAQHKASELIKTIIIASANDSAVAIAEHIAGSEAAFADMMNKKAAELSMNDTLFKTCTGLPAENQYSTAADVSIMARLLMDKATDPRYAAWFTTWMDTLTHPSGRTTDLTNTNRLIRFYDGATGLKTGYSNEAKHCIAACATKGNMRLLTVLLGIDTSKSRFDLAGKLFDYGYSAYEKTAVVKAGDIVREAVPVKGSSVKSTDLIALENIYVLTKKGSADSFSVEENLPDVVTAPVTDRQSIGSITVTLADGTLLHSPVIISHSEINSGLFAAIGDILALWCNAA